MSLALFWTLTGLPAQATKPVPSPECGDENLIAGKLPTQLQDLQGDAALVTDGAVAPEGALWDGPAAVQLATGAGTLTYDLGEARSVSAFYLQADANDTYKIAGSLDGAPGSFKPLAEAASVVDRGPGLRVRTMRTPPATVRYLRLGEGSGDGAYSIAEFAVYCRAPVPFPPVMRSVDAPMAAGPAAAGANATEYVEPPAKSLIGGFEWALAAAILLLVAMQLATKRANGKGEGPSSGVPNAPESTAKLAVASEGGLAISEPIPTAPRSDRGATKAERFFPVLLLLFMGSGCAALIYEIVWFQLLQLVIGSSAVSIGVLLGTFMGGMCVGSLALARFVSRQRHPLVVYAVLELGIGVCGLLMLAAMPLVESVYTSVVGHGVPGLLLRGIFATLCLLPPTAMMGATLPAAARWVETTPRGISWLGYFYAGNTIGAVFGCLFAGFYLLRVHDMPTATYVAVGLNVGVALAVLVLARFAPRLESQSAENLAGAPPAAAPPAGAGAVYVTIALSGMTALGAEVIWTRLFTLLLGGTTYTFSIILAVFLIGIGLGSAVGSAMARWSPNPRRALGFAQFLLVVAIAWTAWNVTRSLPYWPVDPQISPSTWFQFQVDLVRCLWAILPAACLWGASFPLALASVASERQDGGRVVGRIYAANTVGAIIGALACSLVVIAWLGTQKGERILILLAALSAILVLLPAFGKGAGRPLFNLRGATVALVILEVASILSRNVAPVPALLVGHGRSSAASFRNQETYLYVGEGMNSSPAISRDANGIISYHNAGKVQASTQPQDMRLQRMLGHLTTLVPEHPRSVLVVACGAGVTAGAASIDPRVEHLTIAEIEPLVPKAASKYFGDYNFNVVTNPKVRVEIDDARHFLNTTREKFDAITSDPFDPWVKGAASLYTKEFWELAKRHLNPGGVVTVFVQLYQAGTAAVKSEVATFFEVFPRGIIFGNTVHGSGYDVVLLGQPDATMIDVDAMQQRLASPEYAVVAKSLRQIGFNSAVALLSTYGSRGPDLVPWLRNAQINRDRDLRLQFLAGFNMNANEAAQIYSGILPFRRYPEDLFVGSPERLTALRLAMAGRPP